MLPISDKSNDYAREVLAKLREAGVRASADEGPDRIQGKVRVAAEEKIPYMLVVGPRDAESWQVSVRIRGEQKDHGAVALDAFVAGIQREITSRGAERAV